MAGPSRRLAFDANVLIDLALGEEAALTLLEVLSERKAVIGIPPTVIHELSLLLDSTDSERAEAAYNALRELRRWGLEPFDLKSVDHGIAEVFARRLIAKTLLPAGEFNDGCILAEVSLAAIPILVSADKHLLNIDPSDLNALFYASDLSIVSVMNPKVILKSLAPTRKNPGQY